MKIQGQVTITPMNLRHYSGSNEQMKKAKLGNKGEFSLGIG